MDRSSNHQPSKALNNPANHPLDQKVLREQSRSHLARKNQKELESQTGYNVPYGMAAMNPYLMMNPMAMGPMGIAPWMMGYPVPTLPGNIAGIDMANQQSASSGDQSFLAQAASIQAAQPPANVMQAQGNQYASMPIPVYGYPHQMPLVPLQHVPVPQGGFYPMYAQQPYQPQLAFQDTANAMSMITSTIKRKFFGLTYPPVGNSTPKPKKLSVETWKKIREAQKTLRHNWQSEMKLKEKPSDSERRHSGNTLDDLFPGDPKSSKKKSGDKTTRYVQVDMLQAPNPISIQADFAYDYNQEIHAPVSNDIACIINDEKSLMPQVSQAVAAQPAVEQPVIVSSMIESAVMEQPIVEPSPLEQAIVENTQQETLSERMEAIQDDPQGMVAPVINADTTMTLSEPVEIEQIPVMTEALIEPLVVASVQEETIAQERTQPVVTSEVNVANKQVIEPVADDNTITKPQVEIQKQTALPSQTHVNEGLDELFTDASFEDLTAGWKPYSSKPAKSQKVVKQNTPISISQLKQDELPAFAREAESSIWSKMVNVVQKCLTPADANVQNVAEKQAAPSVQSQSKPTQDDFSRLRETMASLQQGAQEEGINTYAMWQQYKQLEGKMYQQKKVIHDLLSVQESFDDTKLDYCYLPKFADNETFVSDLDADMAKDLGLGSFDEIKASVESRHPSLTMDTILSDKKAEELQQEIPTPQPVVRHVDVEVIPSQSHRHYQASADDVYKSRILNSIKNTSAEQGIDTVVQQQRQTVDMRKASLDAAVKDALVYTPTNEDVIAAAMNRHMMGMQGVQSQYRQSAGSQVTPEGTYSMETTVRVEFKQPGCEPVSMTHRVQEDFTVQSMLQSNRMLSNSISSLADEYFKHASEAEI